MAATRSARERKATAEAGPLGTAKIDLGSDQQFVYKISCSECTAREGRAWWTFRPGEDNGYMAAMDRWIFHLVQKHPDAEAPCLAYRGEAEQRLQERRERRESGD